MPAAAAQKITYESLHRYAVDPNRRVQMPFRWRSARPIEFTIIVWPQHECGPCLRVLPPEEMSKLREQIAKMPTTEKTALKRHIGSYSARVRLDSAKRIIIPEEMAVAADIRDQVVFAGMLDYFEMWSPTRHANLLAKEGLVLTGAFKGIE
jgi:division/cell wall cluster transcriptional repressor MraZ